MLRNQTLQPKLARLPKQVWADLSLFKLTYEDALGSACQKAAKIGLTHGKRQIP